MSLFNRNKDKKQKDQLQLPSASDVEEKVRRVEKDMDYLEAQVRLFRREQEGARK